VFRFRASRWFFILFLKFLRWGGVRVSRFGFGRRQFACGQNNIDENYDDETFIGSEVKLNTIHPAKKLLKVGVSKIIGYQAARLSFCLTAT
jgi:hypothetical protein